MCWCDDRSYSNADNGAEEKIAARKIAYPIQRADGIYNAYAAQIHTAKALLLQQACNAIHNMVY
jgi:uncharacterized protein (UPF0332 family)